MATRYARKTRSASPKRKSMRKASKSPRKAMKSKSPRRRSASRKAMKRSASRKSMRRASKSKSPRKSMRKTRKMRKTSGPSAYANFRKMNWKKVQASMPNATFGQIAAAVALMWKKASAKTKSAVRKMVRSPRKVRKMRVSKKRALKKSGSPRRARKDKGKKRANRKLSEYNMFVKKYSAAKKAALGTNNQKMVMKALAADWRAGIRSY